MLPVITRSPRTLFLYTLAATGLHILCLYTFWSVSCHCLGSCSVCVVTCAACRYPYAMDTPVINGGSLGAVAHCIEVAAGALYGSHAKSLT